MNLSRNRGVLLIFLVLFVVGEGIFTYQLAVSPEGFFGSAFFRLLKTEPFVRVAMFDFFLVAGWVWLWMMDDARQNKRFVWGWLPLFLLYPSLSLLLYLLTAKSIDVNRSQT